jgi:hypothetical protein
MTLLDKFLIRVQDDPVHYALRVILALSVLGLVVWTLLE